MSDYISREALKEAFDNADADVCESYSDGYCDWGFGRKNINDVIDGVPAADVEPVRHGEWRLVRRMAACGEYECSVCGRIETFGCFNKPENNPYCHCGAKMCLEDETNDN
jgi:hypothetical protein